MGQNNTCGSSGCKDADHSWEGTAPAAHFVGVIFSFSFLKVLNLVDYVAIVGEIVRNTFATRYTFLTLYDYFLF